MTHLEQSLTHNGYLINVLDIIITICVCVLDIIKKKENYAATELRKIQIITPK